MSFAARDLRELAGLYALDALPPEETAEFEQFLATSPEARQEVDEFLSTAARLGAAEAAVPPAAMKDAVMAKIATTRQERPTVVPFRARRAPRILAAAAVAAAIVVLGGLVVVLNGRLDERDELLAVLEAPDAVRVELASVADAEGEIFFVWSRSESAAVVFTDDLADADDESVYALWGIDDGGTATPLGLFDADADGVRFDTALEAAPAQVAVTIEPAGGSPAPTSAPIAVGQST